MINKDTTDLFNIKILTESWHYLKKHGYDFYVKFPNDSLNRTFPYAINNKEDYDLFLKCINLHNLKDTIDSGRGVQI